MVEQKEDGRDQELMDEQYQRLFNVRRSIRYHSRRRMFFDRWHTITSATGVIFGSATFFALLSQADLIYAQCAALVVTIMATLDLVVGTSQSARLHEDLGRKFIALERQIVMTRPVTQDALDSFSAAQLEIEAKEPPILRVLNCLCFNEQARAEGQPPGEFLQIAWYQRWFANFCDIQDHIIDQNKNLRPAKS